MLAVVTAVHAPEEEEFFIAFTVRAVDLQAVAVRAFATGHR
jgi:hypothetical protein